FPSSITYALHSFVFFPPHPPTPKTTLFPYTTLFRSEKKAVDPKKITPLKPKKERTKEADRQISSNLLPLGAQVSVLETNRTVYTDPADGSYSLMHGAGSYTIHDVAYGFHSQEQEATIEDKETTTIYF